MSITGIGGVGTSGSRTVRNLPHGNHTYTLLGNGFTLDSITVSVHRKPTGSIWIPQGSMRLSETTITVGASVTLKWTTQYADDAKIAALQQASVAASGSATVTPPSGKHTYELTASNADRTFTLGRATVTVMGSTATPTPTPTGPGPGPGPGPQPSPSKPKLSTPTGLAVWPLPNRQALLAWDRVANANQYAVTEHLNATVETAAQPTDANARPSSVIDLVLDLRWTGIGRYTVTAQDTSRQNRESESSITIIVMDNPIVAVNGNSKDSRDGKGMALVKWPKVEGATSYTIHYRKLLGDHSDRSWRPTSGTAWTPIRLSPDDVAEDGNDASLLAHPITGLDLEAIYGVFVNYTKGSEQYFAAREAYVWPSKRAPRDGEIVATYPLTRPANDRTYLYRICDETFPEDRQGEWVAFIQHAVSRWHAATKGLVVTIREVYTDATTGDPRLIGTSVPCPDYAEFIMASHEEIEHRLGRPLTSGEDDHIRGVVQSIANWTEIFIEDRSINKIMLVDDTVGIYRDLKSVAISNELATDLGFRVCAFRQEASACASLPQPDNIKGWTSDIFIRMEAFDSTSLRLERPSNITFDDCIRTPPMSFADRRLYTTVMHEVGHVLGIRGVKARTQEDHHPLIAREESIMIRSLPTRCSPTPFDTMVIYTLYQMK